MPAPLSMFFLHSQNIFCQFCHSSGLGKIWKNLLFSNIYSYTCHDFLHWNNVKYIYIYIYTLYTHTHTHIYIYIYNQLVTKLVMPHIEYRSDSLTYRRTCFQTTYLSCPQQIEFCFFIIVLNDFFDCFWRSNNRFVRRSPLTGNRVKIHLGSPGPGVFTSQIWCQYPRESLSIQMLAKANLISDTTNIRYSVKK